MIKIELRNEVSILEFHYKNLTQKTGKQWLIVDRLDKRITANISRPRIRSMYEYLKNSIIKDVNGFSLITGRPIELESFKNTFEQRFRTILSKKRKKDLLNVFYYDNYSNWKAYELAKKISVNVCPYCNRTYTLILGDDFDKGTRFEYDHFFNKSDYPYLALSFYNLIPSCHVCNSNFKKKSDFSLKNNIHPYIEGFSDNIVFSVAPRNVNFINGSSSSYRIKLKKGKSTIWNNDKVKASFKNISTFQITNLYNMHKDYVDEIIQKSIVYNSDYITSLYQTFGGSLFRSEDDVKRFVLGNYIDEKSYPKRPLSKLTADISKELGLI